MPESRQVLFTGSRSPAHPSTAEGKGALTRQREELGAAAARSHGRLLGAGPPSLFGIVRCGRGRAEIPPDRLGKASETVGSHGLDPAGPGQGTALPQKPASPRGRGGGRAPPFPGAGWQGARCPAPRCGHPAGPTLSKAEPFFFSPPHNLMRDFLKNLILAFSKRSSLHPQGDAECYRILSSLKCLPVSGNLFIF